MKVLVTGGAGFIGSNIVEALLQDSRIDKVRVLDNFSTGHRENMLPFLSNPKFEFIWGDIREYNTCLEVCRDIDSVCHQAALGSVPRSIQNPLTTNNVNITGTLNIFTAARESGIKRIVYAASSSTYGNHQGLPKKEEFIGHPISPYAVTKLVNELYANVFGKLYDMEFIGLRYFNVFGKNQDPNGVYAAIIPLFIKSLLQNHIPQIHGEGLQTRDFTYVSNAVEANLKALFIQKKEALNQVYNIALGDRISIRDLYDLLCEIIGVNIEPQFSPRRAGDVMHSQADISKAKSLLGYEGKVKLKEGLEKSVQWYLENKNRLL